MNDSNDRSGQLSAAKQALLARLRQTAAHSSEIIPRRRQVVAPLSFAQQRLWFLDQFYPHSYVYNVPRVLRMAGHLDVPALQQALNSVLERHEILRTTFNLVKDQPVQVVGDGRCASLQLCDLSSLPEEEREGKAADAVAAEIVRPFDLSCDLMLRATLVKLQAEKHVLILMTHHIASDGWSKGVMFRELATLYNAALDKRPAPLSDLPIQYSDFALWQRQWLKGKLLQDQLAYWKRQLEGAPALLELPTDYPRPSVQGFTGTAEHCILGTELLNRLKAFSQREGATLFMTLLASFQAVLARYTSEEDIVVGTPIAGRTRPELEPLIGDFVNMLAIRTDFSGDPNFRELLRHVKEVALQAYDNQHLPFESLVEELEHGRDLSRAPVFQTIFILETAPPPPPAMDGLSIRIQDFDPPAAKNDLILHLVDDPAGLKIKLEYRTDLFSRSTMQRFLQHFGGLLEAIVSDPDRPVSRLSLLSDDERRLLAEWNNTAAAAQTGVGIHQLFEVQSARTPDAVAVQFGELQITYGELNRRANQLGYYLRQAGTKPDSRIGICIHRSLEMIVGLLGIMKAGAAYVPLDPAYPRERLDFMLQDSGAELLITEEGLESISRGGAKIVYIDRDWPAIAQQDSQNPQSDVKPENLSYVIFTSGSTGKPKGVQLEHRNVVNFLNSVRRLVALSEADTYLGVASMSFDASVMDFYLPLTIGARLVIADAETTRDAGKLAAIMSRSGVTAMHATPSTWRSLIDNRWPGDPRLKIFSGGEALSWDLATQLLKKCSELWNFYGPTETAVYSSIHHVTACDRAVLVGRPIDNTQIHILDAHQQPVPIGLPGEISIAGAGVARGYLNRPELTTEKFLPDPFSGPSGRMYRTGDLGRYRLDGLIECLGRVDHQVKLRGYRIELGEIEAVLRQYPGVRQAVADVRSTGSGDKRLISYLVLQEGGPAVADLRTYLKTKLPDYMVPSSFVMLNSLPLSPNGKLNRRALPDPDHVRPELDREFAAPVTPVEQAVAEIFAEVLEIPQVGLHNDFFELGGHSLLATRVVSRLRDQFQIEMTPRFLFESPTVAEMSARISELLVQDSNPEEIATLLAELGELEEN
jgi:amino acid adenylation domain-containing protein